MYLMEEMQHENVCASQSSPNLSLLVCKQTSWRLRNIPKGWKDSAAGAWPMCTSRCGPCEKNSNPTPPRDPRDLGCPSKIINSFILKINQGAWLFASSSWGSQWENWGQVWLLQILRALTFWLHCHKSDCQRNFLKWGKGYAGVVIVQHEGHLPYIWLIWVQYQEWSLS